MAEILSNRFNLTDADLVDLENDIEYLFFVEHEEDMKNYTHLKALIPEITRLFVLHSDRVIAQYQQDITLKIAEKLKNEVDSMVFGERIITHDKKEVELAPVQESEYDW